MSNCTRWIANVKIQRLLPQPRLCNNRRRQRHEIHGEDRRAAGRRPAAGGDSPQTRARAAATRAHAEAPCQAPLTRATHLSGSAQRDDTAAGKPLLVSFTAVHLLAA